MGMSYLLKYIDTKTAEPPKEQEKEASDGECNIHITLTLQGSIDREKRTIEVMLPEPETEQDEELNETVNDLLEMWVDEAIDEDALSLAVSFDEEDAEELDQEDFDKLLFTFK